MTEQKWTSEQQAAITVRGGNLLVSAGAGSGKTAVLVQRILSLIVDDGMAVDNMLVVTFTKAAAAEMRERLRRALEEHLEKDPSNEHLVLQLALLDQANISTCHAFCMDIINNNFYRLGLSAGCRAASEGEKLLLRDEALHLTMEEAYLADDFPAAALADAYGGNGGDSKLEKLVTAFYDFSVSLPDPELWRQKAPLDYEGALPIVAQALVSGLTAAADRLEAAYAAACAPAEAELNYDLLSPVLSLLLDEAAALRAIADRDSLAAQLNGLAAFKFVNFPSLRLGDDDELKRRKDLAKDARAAVKQMVEKLQKPFCSRPLSLMRQDMEEQEHLLTAFCRLTSLFDRHYTAAKRRRGLIDFADMEHLALRILREDAQSYRERFAAVLVDEYQDINPVQDELLRLVTRGDNLFAVGDVKQSIYRFRQAEPLLFLQKYLAYQDGVGGRLLNLTRNYRSSDPVIEAVNAVFAQLMCGGAAELFYDDNAMLVAGRGVTAPPCELHLVDARPDEDGYSPFAGALDAETQLVARRILQLRAEGVRFGDIAILLRSFGEADKGASYAAALAAYGIPAVTYGKKSKSWGAELDLLLDYLRIVDNPHQDIPLASVLLSPLGGLTASQLWQLKQLEGPLWQQLPPAFAAKLEARRGLRPTQLLRALYDDDGYRDYVAALEDGPMRLSGLDYLLAVAQDYEANSYAGLFRFICYLDDLKQRGEGAAPVAPAQAYAVRIMSIHASKGLQFPVVFLSSLGTKFKRGDANNDMLWHSGLGLTAQVVKRQAAVKYPSLGKLALELQSRREAMAEELRVLYVAMTRAEQQLILTAASARSDLGKKLAELKEQPLNDAVLLADNDCLTWLLRAYHHGADRAIDLIMHDADFLRQPLAEPAPDEQQVVASASTQLVDVAAELDHRYPFAAVSDFAAKWSVSDLADTSFLRAASFEDPPLAVGSPAEPATSAARAARSAPAAAPTDPDPVAAATRGSLFHLLMQHYRPGLLLDPLIACGILPAEALDLLPLAVAFYASSLGKRLLAADDCERECRFTYAAPASYALPAPCASVSINFADHAAAAPNNPDPALAAALEGERVIVQGIADLVFKEPDGWVLVDYKTGGRGQKDAALAARYGRQLELYCQALTLAFGQPFKQSYLYMLDDGRIIPLKKG